VSRPGRDVPRGYGVRAGFTLLEVVVALLVLEIAVVGAVGLLVLASSTLSRAERLERATALAEGVLDSLAAEDAPAGGSASYGAGEVAWTVDAAGEVALIAVGPAGDTLFEIESVLPPRAAP
jgi:type II secretory pathway pseudopilin PulG